MRIGPAANVARLNVDEIITSLWSFANAQGLLTDDINERLVAAGVTIDGVLLRDTTISLLGFVSPSNRVLGCDVAGDADERFRLHAGGIMQWGDGTGALDTQLQRDAPNELGTPDDFNVGGVLDLAGDIEIASRNITLVLGANDDVASGVVPIQRISSAFVGSFISGFAGGRTNRVLYVVNVGNNSVTFRHDEATSAAANRILLPSATDLPLVVHGGIVLWYDTSDSRWRVLTKMNNL